jgi:hypothetical protein
MTTKKLLIQYVVKIDSIKLHQIQINIKIDNQCTPEDVENQMARLVVSSLIKANIIKVDWKRITED